MMTPEPHGIFLEGVCGLTSTNTIFPGSAIGLVAAAAPISGDFTWALYSPGADGDPYIIAIALEDNLEGFSFQTPYTSSSPRIFAYVPLNGEFMNVAVAEPGGTGTTAYTIGERLIATNGTGLFKSQGTAANQSQFMCMEAVSPINNVQAWVWAMRTYNN